MQKLKIASQDQLFPQVRKPNQNVVLPFSCALLHIFCSDIPFIYFLFSFFLSFFLPLSIFGNHQCHVLPLDLVRSHPPRINVRHSLWDTVSLSLSLSLFFSLSLSFTFSFSMFCSSEGAEDQRRYSFCFHLFLPTELLPFLLTHLNTQHETKGVLTLPLNQA